MKKSIYYTLPFIIFLILFFIFTWSEAAGVIELNVYVMYALFLLSSVFIGVLSPTDKKFDYLLSVTVPLSFLGAFFVIMLFDSGCDGAPQLSISHALNTAYYTPMLPIVAILTVITFITSFKPIRAVNKLARFGSKESE